MIFSICIIGLFAVVLLAFGTGNETGTLPLPVSLAGLLLVYAVYAYFDLLWVRKNQHMLTDTGFKSRGSK